MVGRQQRHEHIDALQWRRAKQALTVTVAGGPTGAVFNGIASDFVVNENGKSGAARFLFATEGGTIVGWSPAVNANVAVTGADRSGASAIYKGLATANDKLYATDFHNGRVDVFDKSFNLVPGGFSDPKISKFGRSSSPQARSKVTSRLFPQTAARLTERARRRFGGGRVPA